MHDKGSSIFMTGDFANKMLVACTIAHLGGSDLEQFGFILLPLIPIPCLLL